ncbi:unnamed protein product [Closterium sp. NIES-64]|nr:unnamed protein product [Closterium sp. NIES-64]
MQNLTVEPNELLRHQQHRFQSQQRDQCRKPEPNGSIPAAVPHRTNGRPLSLPRVFSGRLEHLSIPSSPSATSASGRSPAQLLRGDGAPRADGGSADEGGWADEHAGCAAGSGLWRAHDRSWERGKRRGEEETCRLAEGTTENLSGRGNSHDGQGREANQPEDSDDSVDEHDVARVDRPNDAALSGCADGGDVAAAIDVRNGNSCSSGSSCGNDVTRTDMAGGKAPAMNRVFVDRLGHLAIPSPRFPPDTPDSASHPAQRDTPLTTSPYTTISASPCVSTAVAVAAVGKAVAATSTASAAAAVGTTASPPTGRILR